MRAYLISYKVYTEGLDDELKSKKKYKLVYADTEEEAIDKLEKSLKNTHNKSFGSFESETII